MGLWEDIARINLEIEDPLNFDELGILSEKAASPNTPSEDSESGGGEKADPKTNREKFEARMKEREKEKAAQEQEKKDQEKEKKAETRHELAIPEAAREAQAKVTPSVSDYNSAGAEIEGIQKVSGGRDLSADSYESWERTQKTKGSQEFNEVLRDLDDTLNLSGMTGLVMSEVA